MNWKKFGLSFLQRIALDRLLSALGASLKNLPVERLEGWLVRFGKAFGPAGLKHFSELSTSEQSALLKRVPVLKGTHSDWLKPFQWVPRTLTVWVGPAPSARDIIEGDTNSVKPIPANGEWYVLRGYMASTTEDGVHNRLGWRYDDVDDYYSLSISVKLIG